jgi:hypothetical protein
MPKLLRHRSRFSKLLLTALLAATTASGKAEAQSPPAGWGIYPTPEDGSATVQCANYSHLEWRVALSQTGAAQITPRPQPYGAKSSKLELPPGVKVHKGMVGVESKFKIQNGWFLGFDGGEFGGGLWFADLGGKTQELSGENVHGFIETPQGVLAFVGLAHLGLDSGKVLIAPYAVNAPTDVKTLVELDGAPETFTKVSADTVLVVTTQGISRINSFGVKKILLRRRFGDLYPNSVVSTPDGTIYAGMRLFVVRLVQQSGEYTEQWLVPDRCKNFKVRELDCVCTN